MNYKTAVNKDYKLTEGLGQLLKTKMLVSLHLHVQFIGPLFNLPKEKKNKKTTN